MTRVMVVEDERIVALNLQQRLLKLGYEVPVVAASGEQALRGVDNAHPDVVLMDIHIEGGIDGIETAARICAQTVLPIIYLTAYSEEATLERARATKPYGYLLKPFSERELHATIQMALERHEVERALAQAKFDIERINGSLEQQIRDRTGELLQAKETAEQATVAKSLFLANMSHEIRTPLNAVLGLCYLLQKTPLSELQKSYIEKASASAQFLLAMLNDILDFSKIEAGRLELETVDFRLAGMLDTVAMLLSPSLQAKGLELRIDAHSDVPPLLRGDPLRLQQVLVNLGSNAIKFTQRGSVVIAVGGMSQDERGVHLRFSVNDSGIGLAPQHLQHIFEPFTQADASTTRRYGGTGLGLIICKRLVELMGGSIGVSSKPGLGSEFFFSVPLERTSAVGLPPPSRRDDAARALLRGRRILLVEDNVLNQEVARAILVHEGILVEVAADGREAVDRIRAIGGRYFDIVLMDLQMPELDGFAATRAIRALPDTAELPILAMTADTELGDRERAFKDGMDGFVAKPIDVDRLFVTLAIWLQPGARRNRG